MFLWLMLELKKLSIAFCWFYIPYLVIYFRDLILSFEIDYTVYTTPTFFSMIYKICRAVTKMDASYLLPNKIENWLSFFANAIESFNF